MAAYQGGEERVQRTGMGAPVRVVQGSCLLIAHAVVYVQQPEGTWASTEASLPTPFTGIAQDPTWTQAHANVGVVIGAYSSGSPDLGKVSVSGSGGLVALGPTDVGGQPVSGSTASPGNGGTSTAGPTSGVSSSTSGQPTACPPTATRTWTIQYSQVVGISCAKAAAVASAALPASGCHVADQYGEPTRGACAVDGFNCTAVVAYRPGMTQGQMLAATLTCSNTSGGSLKFLGF